MCRFIVFGGTALLTRWRSSAAHLGRKVGIIDGVLRPRDLLRPPVEVQLFSQEHTIEPLDNAHSFGQAELHWSRGQMCRGWINMDLLLYGSNLSSKRAWHHNVMMHDIIRVCVHQARTGFKDVCEWQKLYIYIIDAICHTRHYWKPGPWNKWRLRDSRADTGQARSSLQICGDFWTFGPDPVQTNVSMRGIAPQILSTSAGIWLIICIWSDDYALDLHLEFWRDSGADSLAPRFKRMRADLAQNQLLCECSWCDFMITCKEHTLAEESRYEQVQNRKNNQISGNDQTDENRW